MRDKKKRLGFVLPARRNFDLLSKPPDVETGEVEHLKYEADNAASYESDIGYGAIKQTEKPEELDMHPIVQYRWSTTSDVYSAWNDRSVAASANSDDDRAAVTFAGTRNERKTSDITDDDSQGKVDTDSDRALSGDEDACSKLWAVYIGEAGKYNKDLMISWKQDMEGLLIFSSLYSASLTAFIIQSYTTLQQDPAKTTVGLLTQISLQLSASANGTTMAPWTLPDFKPATSSLACNFFWFLALALALTCSLLATFVQQWTRDFMHRTSMRPSPVLHARILMYLYFGMQTFKMHTIVDIIIPSLLHGSLLFFFAGLIAFLVSVNRSLEYFMACFLYLLVATYLLFTFLPIVYLDAPYRTPLSSPFWYLGNKISRWFSGKMWLQRVHGLKSTENVSLTRSVLAKSHQHREHEQKAVEFIMKSLTDDSELLPLLEAIPDAVYGSEGIREANVTLIEPLLTSDSAQLNIISHIASFSDNPSAWLDKVLRTRCLTAYPRAIWSIAYVLVTKSLASDPGETPEFWFPQAIVSKLKGFHDLDSTAGAQKQCAASALALVRLAQMLSLRNSLSKSQKREGRQMFDLCNNGMAIDWSDEIAHRFRTMQERSCAGMTLDTELHFQPEDWVKGIVQILLRFFTSTNALDGHAGDLYLFYETYSVLSKSIHICMNPSEDFPLIAEVDLKISLCRLVKQISTDVVSNPSYDELFTQTLKHFLRDKQWAQSPGKEPQEGRRILLDFFVERCSDAAAVLNNAESLSHLEACIVAECGNHNDTSSVEDSSARILFDWLSKFGSRSDAERERKILLAITQISPALVVKPIGGLVNRFKSHRQFYPFVQSIANGIVSGEVISIFDTEPWIPPPRDTLMCIKLLGSKILGSVEWGFDNLSLPAEHVCLSDAQAADLRSFRSYALSLHLAAIAKYTTLCSEPIARATPFHLGAFQKMCAAFFHFDKMNPHIHEVSQNAFAESILLLKTTIAGGDQLFVAEKDGPNALRLAILNTVLKISRSWKWITSLKAAEILLEALQMGSKTKFSKREKRMYNHCVERKGAWEKALTSELPQEVAEEYEEGLRMKRFERKMKEKEQRKERWERRERQEEMRKTQERMLFNNQLPQIADGVGRQNSSVRKRENVSKRKNLDANRSESETRVNISKELPQLETKAGEEERIWSRAVREWNREEKREMKDEKNEKRRQKEEDKSKADVGKELPHLEDEESQLRKKRFKTKKLKKLKKRAKDRSQARWPPGILSASLQSGQSDSDSDLSIQPLLSGH